MTELLTYPNWSYKTPFIPFYKDPTLYEISCLLFERCNLKCKFCFEGHRNNKIDVDYIRKIPNLIIDNFKEEYKKYNNIKEVNIMLWGGELFFDALPDSLFDEYKLLVDNFRELFSESFPNIKIRFSWLSNGVFTKWERVKDIIEYSNGIINFSYDPIDRFGSYKQKELMLENSKRFYEFGLSEVVSITLTKQNINEFISNTTDINTMMSTIDVNFYIPNKNWEELMPTDDDIFNFFKWALDNRLFHIKVIEKLIWYYTTEYIQRHCDCKSCSQLTYGEWSVDCAKRSSELPTEMFFGEYANIINEENSNDIKVSLGIKKRGCQLCKYYDRCQMPCWISMVFSEYKTTRCPYEKAYEYIEINKDILYDYMNWCGKEIKCLVK